MEKQERLRFGRFFYRFPNGASAPHSALFAAAAIFYAS